MTLALRPVVSPLRYRLLTLGLVAAFVLCAHVAIPDAEARARFEFLFVITLGYGHLIGAALGGPRARGAGIARPEWLFVAIALVVGLACYAEALALWPGLVVVPLGLSAWHITENDVAIARALRTGASLPAPRLALAEQARPLSLAACVIACATAAPGHVSLLVEVFAPVTLYHLVGWLVFLAARRFDWRRLALLHLPALACAVGLQLAEGPSAAWLRTWLFSPGPYLYFASLHVAQTCVRRAAASHGRLLRQPAQRGCVGVEAVQAGR